MEVVRVPLAETRRFGGREVNAATVAMLKESLAAVGQLSPILVTKGQRNDGPTTFDCYWIVAGKHRTEAARELGWTEIDAVILDGDAAFQELAEIDENLARAELTDAQRAVAHKRREELMVQMGLVKDAPKGGRPAKNLDKLSKYSATAAADLGVDERTVRRDLRRATMITPEVLASVSGTSLDKGVVLDQLAAEPKKNQAAKLAELREHQEAAKLNRYADRAAARTSAERAAELIVSLLTDAQLDAHTASLASVPMPQYLAAVTKQRAA